MESPIEPALRRHRLALLEGVLLSDGALPRGFASLSAAEIEEVDEAREDCRALLRGAVFVEVSATAAAVEALRAHAAASTASALAAQPDSLLASVCALEAALHAMSAAAKPLGTAACAPLGEVVCTLLPAAAQLASNLLAAGEGAGRGLL